MNSTKVLKKGESIKAIASSQNRKSVPSRSSSRSSFWGKKSRRIYYYLERHQGEWFSPKSLHRKLRIPYNTVVKNLRRMMKKGVVEQKLVSKIIYDQDGPHKGPMVPYRGPNGETEYQFVSNAGLESVTLPDSFDVSVLKLHKVDLVGVVLGAWDKLLERAMLTPIEAGNLSRYVGRSMVLDHLVELFRGSARYRGHCEAIPYSAVNVLYGDFVRSVEWFTGVRPANVVIPSFESVVDLPLAEDMESDLSDLGYLKIYFKKKMGKVFARTECFLRNLDIKVPFTSLDEKAIINKMLACLELFHFMKAFLERKLGLSKNASIIEALHERGLVTWVYDPPDGKRIIRRMAQG